MARANPQRVDRLVSLNWDQPLPSVVVILALRPLDVTVVAPRNAASAAKLVCGVVAAHGIEARVRHGANATALDAGGDGRSMRAALAKALDGENVVLDYTGGSKPMAAIGRLLLGAGSDAASRAVYLDVSTGLLRWDDGRSVRPGVTLSARELGELHGTKVTRVGRPGERADLMEEVAEDAPLLLEKLSRRSSVRQVFWEDLLHDIELARGRRPARDENPEPAVRDAALHRLRALPKQIAGGQAHVLPLGLAQEGDWLELYVAERVATAAAQAGLEVDVSINVEARREKGAREHAKIARANPSARGLLLEARKASRGAGDPSELSKAVQRAVERGGEPGSAQETDLEIDVLAVQGHRAYALSCYAGSGQKRAEWKAHEIARRAVQLGGDYARAAFVSLLSDPERDALQERLISTHLAQVRVRVFGRSDLLRWVREPAAGLADFLELAPREGDEKVASVPGSTLDHDLLVTVGGTPVPILQSVLAHGAECPLLVHGADSAKTAELLCEVLRGRAIEAQTLAAGSGFEVTEIAAALRMLPPSVAVDITGGTKVLSTQALLHHLSHGDLQTASYVDGIAQLLRRLAPGAAAESLPTDVSLAEFLHLHDRRLSAHDPIEDAVELPNWPREGRLDAADSRLASRWVARQLRSVLATDDEVVADAQLEHRSRGGSERFDVVARAGAQLGLACVAWGDNHRDIAQAAWKPILAGQDLAGTYGRQAVVAPLNESGRKQLERQLQRKSAGARRVFVFGRADLERWRAGDRASLTHWITGVNA